jgi:exonuclease SbcC
MNATFVNLRSSFKILVEKIVEAGIDQSMLVICGDLFESKTALETDVIYHWKMFCKLLHKENIKTLVIPGNHDFSPNSKLLKDNVSILTTEFKNIVCINETSILDGTVFGAPNIDFYIFSPIDMLIPQMQDNDKIKIALLHESVNYAIYDNNEPSSNNRFQASDLSAFDYAFLGDIHKNQFLTPTVAYSGSFVQKNKGEGLQKGYIQWDLNKKEGVFHAIPLREVYIKIDARNNDCHLPHVTPDQTIRHLSLFHKNCSVSYIDDLKKTLVAKYGYINRIVNNNKLAIDNKINKDDLENSDIIKHKEATHDEIIKSILGDNARIPEIIQHHQDVLKNRSESTFTTYKLNYMCWSNILCYGPNNYIDFRNFKHNIVMLSGKNKEGKSSVIDILIRVLFNECVRGYKDAIINKTKQKGSIKLSFNIGPVEYIIEHLYNRTAKSQQHRLYQDGVNITKDSIVNTYNYLKHDIGIGDYKNFVNMSIALQGRKYLVDMSQNDFISLLTKICNLDILKDVENENKKEINVLKAMNKKLDSDIEAIPKVKKSKINELMETETNLIKQKEDLYQEMANISAELICFNRRYNTTEIPQDLEEQIVSVKLALNSYNPEFKEIHKDETVDGLMQQIHLLEKKLEPIPPKILDTIMNTDYTTKAQIDRPALMKQIKDLQAITYKPDETMIVEKSPQELKNIIDTYKPQSLQPLEVCQITCSTLLDEKHDNPQLIALGLPNYDDINKEIKSLSERIQIFQNNFGALVFNVGCGECNANKQNINKIFDIEFEKGRLNTLVEIIDKRSETVEKYNQAVAYRDQKAQNDILLRNQVTRALNQQITHDAEMYHHAKEEFKHLQNKHNWDTLQKLERRVNWVKEREVKRTELERQKLNEIYQFVSQRDSLVELQKLNVIREGNDQINAEIIKLNLQNASIEKEISQVNTELARHSVEFNKKRDHYKTRKRLIAHHSENVDKLEFLDLYQKVINPKSGIPSYILKQTCMMIEKNCNKILTKIADFTLSIVYDKEVKIFTLENDIAIPASMGSGMQKFVLDLIFRITLTQISSISCPKTLFVDEGFGSLDAENFIAIANILQKLKGDFDSLIIISHISELRNYVDMSIDITRKGYLSSVKFGELTDDQKALCLSTETSNINKRNAEFVNATKEAKEPKESKIHENVEIQKYCDENGGMEAVLIEATEIKIHCRACQKDYQPKHGFIERHLNAATVKTKHDKFIMKLLEK